MPVPYGGSYSKLRAEAKKGVGVGEEVRCPKCGRGGRLSFLSTWVARSMIWLEEGRGVRDPEGGVPLARCGACKARVRVLPEGILPFKQNSLPLIERCMNAYVGPGSTMGLEAAVGVIEGVRPHFTTLHGWLGGLGDRVLGMTDRTERKGGGRKKGRRKPMPASAIVVETAKRLDQRLMEKWHEPVEVAPWKYETEGRRDQLHACARLLNAASFLFADSPYPVSLWHGWVISELDVAGWGFLSRGRCTRIQIYGNGGEAAECESQTGEKRKECRHGSRSPPSGLLAF